MTDSKIEGVNLDEKVVIEMYNVIAKDTAAHGLIPEVCSVMFIKDPPAKDPNDPIVKEHGNRVTYAIVVDTLNKETNVKNISRAALQAGIKDLDKENQDGTPLCPLGKLIKSIGELLNEFLQKHNHRVAIFSYQYSFNQGKHLASLIMHAENADTGNLWRNTVRCRW